jgi:hypothetical protein
MARKSVSKMRGALEESYVYLGILPALNGNYYLKAGKADHPERRIREYATHLPGGLQSMHAAKVASVAAAFAAEQRLLTKLRKLPRAQAKGGEWVEIEPDQLEDAFAALLAVSGSEPFRVHYQRGWRVQNWNT